MSKHVAVLFEFSTLNGGERSMLAVLKRLTAVADLKLSAIAPGEGLLAGELRRLSIPHFPFSVRDQSNQKRPVADLLAELRQIANEANPDVIHANSLSMARLLGQLGVDESGFVRTGHLRDIIRLNRTVIRDLNNNQRLIAVSHATRQFHVDQGLAEDRCEVIYNGVDTDQFQPRDRNELRTALLPQIAADAQVVLNVGQICLRKDQPALARSVCNILDDQNDLHLVMVGTRHSAKEESIEFERSIRSIFRSANRESHLHVLGQRNDVHHLMNAADLLVHVAHQEPFGRVLLEAASSGLPIIATNVGGTSEMLTNDVASLIPPACDDSLRQSLLQMLDNVDKRQERAAAALKSIQARFPIERATENLAAFWRSC